MSILRARSARLSLSRLESPMPDVAVADRTLPHNLEAERSVLGAILLHNDAFNLAAEVIDCGGFLPRRAPPHLRQDGQARRARRRHRSRHAEGGARRASGELDEVGGPAYIAALVDGVPRSTNVEHYARIIKEKATLRNLIFSANKILAERLRRPRRRPTSSSTRPSTRSSRSPTTRCATASCRCATLAQASLDTIEKLHARKELITGVPTGFTDLDEMTSGLQPVGPGHHRGAAVDGQDEPRAEHRAARRHEDRHDGRHLQPRNVEGAAVPAHAHGRGAHRRAPAARRLSRRARLGPAVAGDRHAERGEDLHRRHAVDRRARDARQVPAPRSPSTACTWSSSTTSS